jgi:hypothetical protein
MRDPAVILLDPSATYDELTWLRTKGGFGRDVLGHPNCPPDHWWELAVFYPMEALTSTAGALFLLESPERWTEIERKHVLVWLEGGLGRLSLHQQHLFAAEMAEMVLPAFEKLLPNDLRPREAIRLRREWVAYHATEEQLETALVAAKAAVHSVPFTVDGKLAARCAAHAAGIFNPTRSASAARRALISAAMDEDEVYRGQWERLLPYLKARQDGT